MQIKNRNLFRVTRLLILCLPSIFKAFARLKKTEKRLLIIKTDAIGDYILFRNFIEFVRTSKLYRDYEITLLGNALWADIAIRYDSKYIGKFIFINPDELYEAPHKTFSLAWQLFTDNYEVAVHPTSSRTFIGDGLAAFTAAKRIIGFESDTERIRTDYKIRTDKFYTQLLNLPSAVFFEFERSKFFFETVLDQLISITQPEIQLERRDKNGVMIFPGSGVIKRNWEPGKFLALSKLILQNTSQSIYFIGGDAEVDIGGYLTASLPGERVYNLCGKTSLTELIELIAGAAVVVSNETSAIHIAAATKTTSICILGGGHFGRFLPYPDYLKDKPHCLFEKMDCYNCNWTCKYLINENESYPCVTTVTLTDMWKTLQLLLTET